MQSITVPSVLSPKPHIPPTTATYMLSSAGPRYIFTARPTGSRSSKALLGKAPPYLSSLVTITPTRSMRSSRYISLVIPKAAFLYSSLLSMTGTNSKNRWSWRLIFPSLNISYPSSLPINAPAHSPSVNSPFSYLIPILLFIFLLHCTPVSLLAHHHLLMYHSSVNLLLCLWLCRIKWYDILFYKILSP